MRVGKPTGALRLGKGDAVRRRIVGAAESLADVVGRLDRRAQRRLIGAAGAAVAMLGAGSAALAQTVTDPTGSASVGVPVGSSGSDAQGSLVAYSMGGCAKSNGVAVSYDVNSELYPVWTTVYQVAPYQGRSCPWGSSKSAQAPVAVAKGDSSGAVSYSDSFATGTCWNPFNLGCVPSVVLTEGGGAYGGTISYGGEGCSANDFGPVPGIAVCDDDWWYSDGRGEDTARGSIAIQTGDGAAYGRLLAFSNGNPAASTTYGGAYSDNVAVSQWRPAQGGKAAVSLHDSAYSGTGGVAVAGVTWQPSGYPRPTNAYTGPGGASVAGGNATGGAVAVAAGDATTSTGGVAAVSLTGHARGGVVNVGYKGAG
jgi:hypothetical protein